MTHSSSGRIKLAFIVSIEVRWLHLEWMCRELDREQFDISVVLVCLGGRTPSLQKFLTESGIPFQRIDCSLNPISLIRATHTICRYCLGRKIDIVHTHMFLASLVGLLGAFFARVPVRVNTRHHHLKHRSRPIIWLDHLANHLATRIVIASRLVHERLFDEQASVSHKLARIRFGIDLESFGQISSHRIAQLKQKYNPSNNFPVIGVIARYLESKGIQYIIPAFRQLLQEHPSALLVLAYARGPDKQLIRKALAELPSDRYIEIEFEDDVFALYQLFDICVHVPVEIDLETFGLIYIEALAAGIPTVFTLSGVGPEFLVHKRNTWLVDYRNSDQIHQGLEAILESRELREKLILNGHNSVEALFDLHQMVRSIADLYREWFRLAKTRKPGANTTHLDEVSPPVRIP